MSQQQSTNTMKRKWFLLIENPSKSNHLGTLLRCAAAFQVHQVLLVGCDKFNCRGSFGSHLFLDIMSFHCWEAAIDYVRKDCCSTVGPNVIKHNNSTLNNDSSVHDISNAENNHVSIIGILGAFGGGDNIYSQDGLEVYKHSHGYVSLTPPEDVVVNPCNKNGDIILMKDKVQNIKTHINSNENEEKQGDHTKFCQNEHDQHTNSKCIQHRSFSIHLRPFHSHVCFLLSKDKSGLSIQQAELCDGFVHVPHLNLFEDIYSETAKLITKTTSPELHVNGNVLLTQQTLESPLVETVENRVSKSKTIVHSNLLDMPTTLSIVLHHFTAWAQYIERPFMENCKFVKDARPTQVSSLGVAKYCANKDLFRNHDEIIDEHEEQKATIILAKLIGDESVGDDY